MHLQPDLECSSSQMHQLKHGTPADGVYDQRTMLPLTTFAHSSGLASPENVIPQLPDQLVTYVSNVASGVGTITDSTFLPDDSWISFVEASLNANKPCQQSSVAGAVHDNKHTGSLKASSNDVTVPQTTLLDPTKVFALCYAVNTGTTADDSWADSYIRVNISQASHPFLAPASPCS